jgi:hypothetical protein
MLTTLASIALLLIAIVTKVAAGGNPLLFTPNQMAEAYRYQHYLGARLHHPLNPQECLSGRTEFIASYQGREFSVPCQFLTETVKHLKSALESGVVKYLFPLDCGQARLGVPLEVWQAKYSNMATEELLPALVREPTLAALYQTSAYLEADPIANRTADGVWGTGRNVLGFYDGRAVEISAGRVAGTPPDQPEGYRWVNGFVFLASSLGELHLFANGTFMSFDIAFDDDRGEIPSVPLNVSAVAR